MQHSVQLKQDVMASAMLPCLVQVERQEYLGKMAGAVGNYNAHIAAYPGVAWDAVARDFVQSLGLQWNPCVTQVHNDHFCIASLLQW